MISHFKALLGCRLELEMPNDFEVKSSEFCLIYCEVSSVGSVREDSIAVHSCHDT